MTPTTENILNCPCGYGNNLPISTEKCPTCGLNLVPLSRIYQLAGTYNHLGNESNEKHRPGVALSFYSAAQQSALHEDTYPILQAIEIYLNEKNSRLASDLLAYAMEIYPKEEIWEDVEKRIEKLKDEISGQERKRRILKTSFYIISGLMIILLSSFILFVNKARSKKTAEKPLNDYVVYFQGKCSDTPEFKNIRISSDSLVHFSGNLEWVDFQKFWSLLSATDLPLSRINIQEVAISSVPGQVVYVNYKVRSGESLSKIAYSVYHDAGKWNIILDANKDIITHKNILKPGIQIKIPLENSSNNE